MTVNKEIARFHFITTDHPDVSHANQAIRAYKAGCKWVQLRMKSATKEEIEKETLMILPVANEYKAILLINDHADIVLKTGAHGVHLGKTDLCPAEARALLGPNFIIGGTSNTTADIISLINKGVDYVGLGPFRFTSTKKNLSPILGIDGYKHITSQLKDENMHIPIVAIGGIVENDVESLLQTNIYGIAVSGAILRNDKIEENMFTYLQLIENNI